MKEFNIRNAKMVNLIDYANENERTSINTSSLWGNAFERAFHDFNNDPVAVSAPGKIDIFIKIDSAVKTFNKVECKTGAGELRHDCRGNKYIVYCPVVRLDRPLYEQECFIIKRTVFIDGLKKSGLYRDGKRTSDGDRIPAIQTFWVHKTQKPHGKKIYSLLDMLYEYGTPIQDYIDGLN